MGGGQVPDILSGVLLVDDDDLSPSPGDDCVSSSVSVLDPLLLVIYDIVLDILCDILVVDDDVPTDDDDDDLSSTLIPIFSFSLSSIFPKLTNLLFVPEDDDDGKAWLVAEDLVAEGGDEDELVNISSSFQKSFCCRVIWWLTGLVVVVSSPLSLDLLMLMHVGAMEWMREQEVTCWG